MLSSRTSGVLDSNQKQFERTAIQISLLNEPVGRQDTNQSAQLARVILLSLGGYGTIFRHKPVCSIFGNILEILAGNSLHCL